MFSRNCPLKNSQLLRRRKKFKLSHINKYASTLNFFCFLHLGFLNEQHYNGFFNIQIRVRCHEIRR